MTTKVPNSMLGAPPSANVADYKTVVTSWTDALTAALAVNKHVFIPALADGQFYDFGEITPPSNRTIWGLAQSQHYSPAETYTKNAQPQIRPASGASAAFKTTGRVGLTFAGLFIDGVDYSADGIETGGDNITLRDVTMTKLRNGYGSESLMGQTSFLENCRIGDCYQAVKNIVDTTIMGGSLHDCRYANLYLGAGASSNRIDCRIEGAGNWGGNGSGSYSLNHTAWNVIMGACNANVFNVQSDYGRAGAYYIDGAKDIEINGWIRRPGRATSIELAGATGQTAYYFNNTERVRAYAEVIKDNLDGGTGTITPEQVFVLGSTENKDLEVKTNWANAFETAPYTGSLTKRVRMSGNGAPKRPLRTTGIAAAGGTGAIQLVTQKNFDINGLSNGRLIVTARVSGNVYQAEIPYHVWNNSGTQTFTMGTPANEIGTAGKITVAGAGEINIAAGSVSVLGSYLNIPFTITNNHATLTADVYMRFENDQY